MVPARRVLARIDQLLGAAARRVPTETKVRVSCAVGRRAGRALDDRRADLVARGLARWHLRWRTTTTCQVIENLEIIVDRRLADGEREQLAYESLRTYFRFWIEYTRMLAGSPERNADRVVITGLENIDAARNAGRGAVVVSFHMGQFEVASAALAHRVGEVLGIARTMESEAVAEILMTARVSAGNGRVLIVDPARSRASDAARLVRTLRSRGVVAAMIDRFVVGASSRVPFCGREIALARGPALLALRTGSAILPSFTWSENGVIHGRVGVEVPHPEGGSLDERCDALLIGVAQAFEDTVRRRPTEWHLNIPLFAARPRT